MAPFGINVHMVGKYKMAEKMDDQSLEGSILIGADVEFKGELNVPNRASVNGKFEGVLKAKELFVGKAGQVSGEISVDNADIWGTVENTLTVQTKLTLRSSGSISGSVSYSNIMVEEGGVVMGKIDKLAPKTATGEANVVQLQASAKE
jgi:cytoskeletal protein CcmA (bactofilin family)